jgi:hypothetical protein
MYIYLYIFTSTKREDKMKQITLIDNRIGDDAVSKNQIGSEIIVEYNNGRCFVMGRELSEKEEKHLLKSVLFGDLLIK